LTNIYFFVKIAPLNGEKIMLTSVYGLKPTALANSTVATVADFRLHLSTKNYQEAAKVVEQLEKDTWIKRDLRVEMLCHLKKTLVLEACMPVLLPLVAFDTEETAYGLHEDWLQADAASFQALLSAYKMVLEEKGRTSEQLLQILTKDLAGFLTYKQFTLEQAKILITELPGFDPRTSRF
jgi:hypothetical protein